MIKYRININNITPKKLKKINKKFNDDLLLQNITIDQLNFQKCIFFDKICKSANISLIIDVMNILEINLYTLTNGQSRSLVIAAQNNNIKLLNHLISLNKDDNGRWLMTRRLALLYAIENNNLEIVSLLIEKLNILIDELYSYKNDISKTINNPKYKNILCYLILHYGNNSKLNNIISSS